MNANYSEALELQLQLLRDSERLVKSMGGSEAQGPFFGAYTLRRASPYFWSTPMAMLLEKAAASLTNWTLDAEAFPSEAGFALFETAMPTRATNASGVRGISWASKPDRNGVVLVEWCDTPLYHRPVCHNWVTWIYGESLRVVRDRLVGDDDGTAMAMVSRVAAMCALLRQTILVPAVKRVERHVAKRVQREGFSEEPIVRVVELRRRESVGLKGAVESVERAWSCQWMVRGHWRQQFYPSQHVNQPIWITPYVKGPDDKPLKPPRATVFAVVR